MSLAACLVHRPPLVVFTLTLFAFALTTLILAFVVDGSGEKELRNPDPLDWNTFLTKVAGLDFCVRDTSNRTERAANLNRVEDPKNDSRLSLSVPISMSFIKHFHASVHAEQHHSGVVAVGQIDMRHLDKGRLGRYHGVFVNLSLTLPQVDDRKDQDLICIHIEGPSNLIDELNSGVSPEKCHMSDDPAVPKVSFKTHTKQNLPADWCADGSAMTLTYDAQPEWTVYVTKSDKELIYLHLMCSSAFLFVLAVSVVIVACLRGFTSGVKTVNRRGDVMKSMGDDRGDMQMLSQSYES